MNAIDVVRELRNLANPAKSKVMQGFFKTGPGQYGEGDLFIGVSVPKQRLVAMKFSGLPFDQIGVLLGSRVHEERLVALLILVRKYVKAARHEKQEIFKFYLDNMKNVNNWDLVDSSAPYILGAHLMEGDRKLLYRLARSDNIWFRRIAIVSTLHFIRNDDFAETLKIASILLGDKHDLIHKATGWMLREVGKRNQAVAEAFVKEHYRSMPRTMLRYAIERMPKSKRIRYMKS